MRLSMHTTNRARQGQGPSCFEAAFWGLGFGCAAFTVIYLEDIASFHAM